MTATAEFVENAPATADVSLNDGLATESVANLADFAEEPGGPLPGGWYKADIIEGYATRSGKQIETKDEPSKNGDSRNMTLALKLTTKSGEVRNLLTRQNYRISDLTPERLDFVKQMREEYKGVKGKWSDSDAQRTSLAIAVLGQIQKAVGFAFTKTVSGNLVPTPLIGQSLDVRLKVDENNYNEVNAFAPAGSYTGGKRSTSAKG